MTYSQPRVAIATGSIQRNAALQAVLDAARAEFEASHGESTASPIERRDPITTIRAMNELSWRCREAKYEPLLSTIRSMKADGRDDASIAAACGTSAARVAYVRGVWGIRA